MSDTSNDNSEKNKGSHINSDGISCIPCRCKRQFYHKETKTIKEDNKITTNTVIDKRNTKFDGRNVSPNENTIFQAENQLGSVEICDTGWNNQQNRITPEEVEEQVDELRVEVKEIKSDVEKLTSNLNIID